MCAHPSSELHSEEKDSQLRTRILRTCYEQFFKYGVRTVTMDDIATALGMSKKTIYHYFANKEEIVLAVMKLHQEQDTAAMEAILARCDNPVECLLELAKHNAQLFEQMNPSLVPELKKYHPEAWEQQFDYECGFWLQLNARLIADGIQQELFRGDINPSLAALMHTLGFETVIFSDHPGMQSYSFAERFRHYEMMFLYSLVTEKGKALLEESLHTA